MKTLQIILGVTVLAVPPLCAQVVNDGASRTLINETNTITGDVTVGTNGSFTLLVLSNNALLTNSVNGVIGRNVTAKSNEVRLTSATAHWRMGGNLFVGSNGPFNRLIVSNGAFLDNNTGFLGRNAGSSNNFALVTGNGSLWSNRVDLAVGILGGGNQLVVSDGGALRSALSIIGYLAGANSNAVNVTGPGAAWNIGSDLHVGLDGVGNQMTVSNGGSVFGAGQTFVGSGNGVGVNTLTVTGSGSMWSNAMDFIVGSDGASNRLEVRNGGLLQNGRGSLGADAFADNNIALVTGASSVWSNGLDFIVGDLGSGNQLVVSSSGTVSVASNGVIGHNPGADSNSAIMTDPGSRWLGGLSSDLIVGSNSSFNRLVISNGATVFPGDFGYIGYNAAASSNTVTVTGSGSVWTNRQYFYVGLSGAGNQLTVSNGAKVFTGFITDIGNAFSATNNAALVTGSNSSWQINGRLAVGSSGGNNQLTVANGGTVLGTDDTYIGFNSSANVAQITDANSVWINGANLYVGNSGNGNRLVAANEGTVTANESVIVGASSGSLNNRVSLDGGKLLATNTIGTGTLDVRRGTNVLNAGLIDVDRLVLTNPLGRFEFNGGTLITRGAVISNGAAFVVGPSGTTPAIWDVRAGVTNTFIGDDLTIGRSASFNQLILTNNALLTNFGVGTLGLLPGANSNSATLAGVGSRWLLDDGVFVGHFGSVNRLVVSNGAALVTGGSSSVGHESSATNNEVVVTGPGSTWTNLVQLFVGFAGRGNRLLVSNGGRVVSSGGILGEIFADSTNNLAVVTDAGSSWLNAFELRVGDVGAANRLVVSNTAVVFAGSAVYIGFNPTSTGNRLTVDGGTLRTTNSFGTSPLDVRRGTNVLNAGLVDVDRLLLTNTPGGFEFNGGTLSVKGSTVNNGQVFRVGNGVSAATLVLATNGTHSFAGGLIVSSNAAITGNGGIAGAFTVQAGGLLSPGTSIGKIVSINSPLLQGTTFMEISRNGATVTNDQLAVMGSLTYGGTLTVTNIGPNAPASGNHFQLFSAASYAGSFTAISLPPLPPGLNWTNKLLVNGSIDVVGTALPKFASITVSGANVIITGTNGLADAPYTVLTSTNVALPLSNWVSIATNLFGPGGEFSFTNAIAPGIPQRFYQIFIYD